MSAQPPGWRERLLGDRDRLGWWLVPLFFIVGLGGAVLAGSLAVVYYAQQVAELEEETRSAREELVGAAEDVREAADDALEEIDREVASVRDELARGLPLEEALEVGVVRLEVDTQLEVARDEPPPPADEEADEGAQDPDADDAARDQAATPPPEPVPLRRAGSGFVAVVDGGTAFLVTSLGLLDDPRSDDRVPADVDVTVRLPAGSTTASVHSWDEANDLLLLRAYIGNVEPLPWRAEGEEDVAPCDRVVAVGATPDLQAVRVGAEVSAVTQRALVTTLPALHLLAGGPVVDVEGRVVGVASESHEALGGDPLVVPIRRLCDDLLATCPD
jgi:S1-C subfamily serine protease